MFSKSNLLGTLVGFVAIFIIGYVFFGPHMDFFWDAHSIAPDGYLREEPIMILFFLGMILTGFFISTIYGKIKKENHSFWCGAEIGAIVAAFSYLGVGMMRFAMVSSSDFTGYLLGAVLTLIQFAIVGGLIALVYKAVDKKKE